MSVVGYARVSTTEQDPALQHDALAAAGAVRVFTDYASGATTARPQLTAALDHLRPGDVLTVWRIDRLGRSVTDLVTLIGALAARDVQFRSLTESIDTTTGASSPSRSSGSWSTSSASSSATAPPPASRQPGPRQPRRATHRHDASGHRGHPGAARPTWRRGHLGRERPRRRPAPPSTGPSSPRAQARRRHPRRRRMLGPGVSGRG